MEVERKGHHRVGCLVRPLPETSSHPLSGEEFGSLSLVGELLRDMLKALVDHPSEVRVAEVVLTRKRVYEVDVAPADWKRVIGIQGGTITAIRCVMAAAVRNHHDSDMDVCLLDKVRAEQQGSAEAAPTEPPPFKPEALSELVTRMVNALIDQPLAHIQTTTGLSTLLLEVMVPKEMMGQAIGRRGAHMEALRVILRSIGGKLRQTIALNLIEPIKREAA